jgi:hypothetical protein
MANTRCWGTERLGAAECWTFGLVAFAQEHGTTMTFRPNYLIVVTVLFIVEVAIARGYIPSAFVRNSVGDVLVIPLLYFLLRGLTKAAPAVALVIGLAVGLAAELLQYLHLADLLGLKQGSLPYIVLGNTFSWSDLLMYSIGGILAAWLDVRVLQKHRAQHAADINGLT